MAAFMSSTSSTSDMWQVVNSYTSTTSGTATSTAYVDWGTATPISQRLGDLIHEGVAEKWHNFMHDRVKNQLYPVNFPLGPIQLTDDNDQDALNELLGHRTVEMNGYDIMVTDRFEGRIVFPDGHSVMMSRDGRFLIDDSAAKVIYQANNIREFNKYINASDLLERFIDDMGSAGVKQHQMLSLPIELFIHWLIYNAAMQDGIEPEVDKPILPALLPPPDKPRCLSCGRFIRRADHRAGINFCGPTHLAVFQRRLLK